MKTALSFLIVLALAAGMALAADVSGAWKASVPGRGGENMEMTFNLKAEGGTVTGNISSQMGETPIQDGKISGDTVTFKVKREFNGNTVIMNYEGKISGNEIKFKSSREGSERPPREFTAKKVS